MKKISKIKRLVGICLLLILFFMCAYVLLIVKPNEKHTLQEVEKIKFDYILYDRDSNLYEENFNDLKEELNKENIDYEKYASIISKLFVIDFYTLNNKDSKEDIGGSQFVKKEIKDNFKLNASQTIYKYISDMDQKQKPEVSSINLIEIKNITYNINDVEYDAYVANLTWEYKEDLGYDNRGEIYMVKEGEQLFIVEKK